jgi:MFS family permease
MLLTLAALAGSYARITLGPLQETMRVALGLSDNHMAILQGPALALPMVAAAIPLGLIIDRYSRVRLLVVLAAFNLAGSVLTATAPNFTILIMARCLIGLSAFATAPVAYSLLADLYPPAQRGRATMVMALGQVGGLSIAFALGGALVVMPEVGPNSWRWAMLWLSAPLLPVVFAMLIMREPPRSGVTIEKPSVREAFAELWRYRTIIAPLFAGIAIVQLAEGASGIWAAPTLSRSFGLSPDRVGAIMAIGLLISGMLGPVTGGLLADHCQRGGGPRRTLSVLIALACLSIPAGLFAVAQGVVSATVLLFVFATIGGAINVMVTTLLTVIIPNELRGLCMSVMMAICLLFGFAVAPLSVSLVSGAIGGPEKLGEALSSVCVVTCIAGTVMFILGKRHLLGKAQTRTADAEATAVRGYPTLE